MLCLNKEKNGHLSEFPDTYLQDIEHNNTPNLIVVCVLQVWDERVLENL